MMSSEKLKYSKFKNFCSLHVQDDMRNSKMQKIFFEKFQLFHVPCASNVQNKPNCERLFLINNDFLLAERFLSYLSLYSLWGLRSQLCIILPFSIG